VSNLPGGCWMDKMIVFSGSPAFSIATTSLLANGLAPARTVVPVRKTEADRATVRSVFEMDCIEIAFYNTEISLGCPTIFL
jgi:hypothetical protein